MIQLNIAIPTKDNPLCSSVITWCECAESFLTSCVLVGNKEKKYASEDVSKPGKLKPYLPILIALFSCLEELAFLL